MNTIPFTFKETGKPVSHTAGAAYDSYLDGIHTIAFCLSK
jgi:hypothetical protein